MLPTKSYFHACKKVESALQKGREILYKVRILPVFVKILARFIKIQTVFDKITSGLGSFSKENNLLVHTSGYEDIVFFLAKFGNMGKSSYLCSVKPSINSKLKCL